MSESTRRAGMVGVRTSGEPFNHALLTMYAVTEVECRASGCARWSFNSEAVMRADLNGSDFLWSSLQAEFR